MYVYLIMPMLKDMQNIMTPQTGFNLLYSFICSVFKDPLYTQFIVSIFGIYTL